MRLIIISNRLPLRVLHKDNNIKIVRSEGGVATGILSLESALEKICIGWPGIYLEDALARQKVTEKLQKQNFYPVFLSLDQIQEYYHGYSNSTIWPLCHYFFSFLEYEGKYWQAYKEVNALFCEAALQIIRPGDIVWIQDYQLMLLPQMLRERMPELSIGYFHHIPFPSYELFRVLPERAELLRGLLGADLVAFHTHGYLQHFANTVYRILDIENTFNTIQMSQRSVHISAIPMGINYDLYYNALLTPAAQERAKKLSKQFGSHKLILSVDRLDYSKGILHRLKGFDLFLERHPEYRNKVSLVMIVVPSRDNVEAYADLKVKIDKAIGGINGKYSTLKWRPVYYFYRSFSFEELTAMYNIADVALVTPLRDGMNLVAKEYIAAKRDKPGVLILSEMAGASIELQSAIIINPTDTNEIADAILQSLEMPKEQQLENLQKMQEIISVQTVQKWATDFVNELVCIKHKYKETVKKRMDIRKPESEHKVSNTESDPNALSLLQSRYRQAGNRLIMLDYDGTLAPFTNSVKDAAPSPELMSLLQTICNDPKNQLVVNSGRDQKRLEEWLGHLPIGLVAEHGAAYKENDIWLQNVPDVHWETELLDIIRNIKKITPNSKIELKRTSIAWHYRGADNWLSFAREKQLLEALIPYCFRKHFQILKGNKVVEVKMPECNKGTELTRLLQKSSYDFILAMGDDVSDEDMFSVLPADAVSIKVGPPSEQAIYNVVSQADVLPFLEKLIKDE